MMARYINFSEIKFKKVLNSPKKYDSMHCLIKYSLIDGIFLPVYGNSHPPASPACIFESLK